MAPDFMMEWWFLILMLVLLLILLFLFCSGIVATAGVFLVAGLWRRRKKDAA